MLSTPSSSASPSWSRRALLMLAFALLVAGCVKQDPLIMQRTVIEPGAGEIRNLWVPEGQPAKQDLSVPVPLQMSLRGDHEVGIICDDATWQVVLAGRETFGLGGGWGNGAQGKEPPYYAVPGLGASGLECDQIPNCHFLGILADQDCPGAEPKVYKDPIFAVTLPLEMQNRRYEIVVLRSRAQRGLPLPTWANAPAPPLGSAKPMTRVAN